MAAVTAAAEAVADLRSAFRAGKSPEVSLDRSCVDELFVTVEAVVFLDELLWPFNNNAECDNGIGCGLGAGE